MQAHPDTVKKGCLKYKASRIKGRSAVTVTQGPKTSYKELYVVFRAPSGAEKFLDFYQNDRKYSEMGPPKWTVDLSSTLSVTILNDNRVCFCLELDDGGACLFEAKTMDEAEEWVACFNAVLFNKGMHGASSLHYQVELYQSERLEYHGPAYLELAEGYLVVWTLNTQEEVVKWKLSHIRSFKAKKTVLTIYTGSRSATGVGEFHFNSPLSVQITHAIETLVARLKSKKSPRQTGASASSSGSSRPPTRPLPPAPESIDGMPDLLEHSENVHRLRTSLAENIPRHNALSVYENPDTVSRQQQPSPPRRGGYEEVPDGPAPNEPGVRRKPSPPRRGGYEEVPGGLAPNKPGVRRKPSPPTRGGYEEVPGGPSTNEPGVRRKPSPPLPRGARELTPPIYSQVDKSAKTKSRPPSVHNRTSPPREPYGQLNHFLSDSPTRQEYGKLVHTNKPPTYLDEEYGHLGHGAPTNTGASGHQPEEYGRLEHAVTTPTVGHQPEEYGRLGHAVTTPTVGYQPEEYGRLEHAVTTPTVGHQPEEYGRLGHGAGTVGGYQSEEYGRLNRSRETSPKVATPQTEEYGRLGPAFDPYGTLLGEDLEKTLKNGGKTRVRGYEMMEFDEEQTADDAIYSAVDDEIKVSPKKEVSGPPPGYENHVLKVTAAERASYSRSSSQDDKSPTSSPIPPQRSVKHKYVNVNNDGTVKLPPAPGVAPRRYKSNGVALPNEEKAVSGLHRGRSLEESSPPPPAPRHRATVHASRYSPPQSRPPTASRYSPPQSRPPTAPKPKPKPGSQ